VAHRATAADAPMGPKQRRSTALTPTEEAVIARSAAARCCRSTMPLRAAVDAPASPVLDVASLPAAPGERTDAPGAAPPRPGTLWRRHAFDPADDGLDVEHRLTTPAHPWINGRFERMNRTIKDATARWCYDDTHDQLREHLSCS
jgi:hypothetical protein